MAYTSDFRLKNYIKDLHFLIIQRLENENINTFPELRIFDESTEDSKIFNDGGLTFLDPRSGNKYGSNDAAWTYQGKPIAVIEGTFGTERGQFGDGQLNRFSHSVGVAVNGFLGITLIPFKGESYSKTGIVCLNDPSIRIKYANIHKGFLLGAINVNEKEPGNFLVIDVYNQDLIIKLIIEAFKKQIGKNNNFESVVNSSIEYMKNEIKDWKLGEKSNQIIDKLYSEDGSLISQFSRYYNQNYPALTTSEKRDGHGLFGKCLLESYISGKNKYFAIFLRLNNNDIANLKNRKQKEFTFLLDSPHINILNFDQLIFNCDKLRNEVLKIKDLNLFQERKTELFKEVQKAFHSGNIRVKNF